MAKHLHAVEFDGTTFGMSIDTSTIAWKKFKKSVKYEPVISCFGDEFEWFTVPYLMLAAIMQEAHWLVSEVKDFDKFTIDGFNDGYEIYVKYTDEPIDFRNRRNQIQR